MSRTIIKKQASAKSFSRSDNTADLICSLKAPSVPESIGITRFISQVLRRGRPFRVNVKRKTHKPAGTNRTSQKGKEIGRYTDLLFQRVCAGKIKLDPNKNTKHKRCYDVFKLLKKMNLVPVCTQKTVTMGEDFKLKTQLDGIAFKGSTVCVLELKCSQFTMAEHKLRYTLPAIGNATMANKAPNTESTAHQLQLAFGVLGLRHLLAQSAPEIRTTGCLLVSCADGALSYPLNTMFLSPSWFDLARNVSRNALPKVESSLQSFMVALPEGKDRQKIEALLKAHKRGTITSETSYGSFVTSTEQGAATVVTLLHNPGFKSSSNRMKGSRERVIQDALRLRKKNTFKSVRAGIVQFHEGQFKFSGVRKIK